MLAERRAHRNGPSPGGGWSATPLGLGLVRGWDFDSAGNATNPLANYPATNRPYDTWYQDLLTRSGAIE
ncbi:hypothetical protein [Nonomuraea basaltis]|uniref:hypothetical protein n=1 Tax=Nonomuraea basaltis TaxID=2495887 RepID=UPI00110C6B00|nr:hypothetical protein [Nonomuraea basaltis]TMR99750.1 hypothetical protein EJK15_05625 [Nonomuraea basaltis]